MSQPRHRGGSHAGNEEVGTNNVQLSNARRVRPFKEDEMDSQDHVRHGHHIEGRRESSLAILPARRSPFTTVILAEVLAAGVKIANLPEYEGT